MRKEPIHEIHCLSYSDFVDKKIAVTVPFSTPLGLPLKLWFNGIGNVIGVDYYREQNPKESS